ncbi:hypothetical protein AAFC00_003917 [Neodothiora populina]|uniref:DUF221-domain-containing protein n=1 Tax=Neodothiora populina TaxID=2781224 RepID=A0ABR3PG49_9PEZI
MSDPAGSHQDTSTPSASSFLVTLIPVLVISSVVLGVFLLFRPKVRRVYEPRTFIPLLDDYEKTPQPSNSRFGWISDFRSMQDDYVLNHSSLDNYLFLRMFKVMAFICIVGTLITWPILMPINATGGFTNKQFDKIAFSNVNPATHPNYYYAHCLVAWVFLGFVMLVITRETVMFITLRQSIIFSQAYKSRISNRTVLFTTVPKDLQSETALRELFSGVRRVWIQPQIKELSDLVGDRDKAVSKLEAAENKLCITLVKNRKKAEKKAAKSGKTDDIPLVENERDGGEAARIEMNKKDRPTHRLKIPLIGKKVDTIDWARPEIQSLNDKIDAAATKVRNADKVPAAFVEFETLEAAQFAWRQVKSRKLWKKDNITPKTLGVQPEDVIWKNLGNNEIKNKLFSIACNTFVTVLVIFWAIPVAFVGAISNIGTLTKYSFLAWINDIPTVLLGVVSGLIPAVLLAVLMALVPIIMRLLAGLFMPTRSGVELKTQSWYFAFQVVDVFLVTTFASGAASTASTIVDDPSQAPTLLAQNLPKASNFYTAYFVVTMLQQAAMVVLNVAPLLFALVLGKILDKTPRKVYNRYTNLIGLGWGSVYPAFVMLGCIAIAYSCIAPLLLGFASVGFGVLYLAYRYQLFYVIGNHSIDMKGRAYARGLQQLTVGVYLSEFCLIGLFAIGCASSPDCAGPLVLMIIFTVFTVIYHVILKMTLGPIIEGLELIPGTEGDSMMTKDHSLAETEEGRPTKDTLSPTETSASTADPAKKSMFQKGRGFLLKFFFSSPLARKFFYPKHGLAAHFDNPIRPYTEEEESEAYLPPAITSRMQVVWIARDPYGLSKQEVAGCEEFNIPASDAEASLTEKAAVHWDQERLRHAPIYEEEVPY